jgi:DNA-damage-inducible protein J
MIYIRIDEQLKEKAAETLDTMGLSLSDAVRVFLVRVVAEKQMPFSLKVPNAETLSSMAEAEEIIVAKRARYKTGADLIHDLEKTSGQ